MVYDCSSERAGGGRFRLWVWLSSETSEVNAVFHSVHLSPGATLLSLDCSCNGPHPQNTASGQKSVEATEHNKL